MKTLITFLFLWTPALALEVVSQDVLCERFVTESEKSQCLKFMKEKKPDTYVSSVCQDIFDDKLFYQCLNVAAQTTIDPRQLETCQVEGASDETRMNCLKKVAKKDVGAFQRMPASLPKRK